MHNLLPFSHLGLLSINTSKASWNYRNLTQLIRQLTNILFPDLALWKEKAKQLQIQEKVHDHQICFKRENQRQRLQGPSNG